MEHIGKGLGSCFGVSWLHMWVEVVVGYTLTHYLWVVTLGKLGGVTTTNIVK